MKFNIEQPYLNKNVSFGPNPMQPKPLTQIKEEYKQFEVVETKKEFTYKLTSYESKCYQEYQNEASA